MDFWSNLDFKNRKVDRDQMCPLTNTPPNLDTRPGRSFVAAVSHEWRVIGSVDALNLLRRSPGGRVFGGFSSRQEPQTSVKSLAIVGNDDPATLRYECLIAIKRSDQLTACLCHPS